MAANEEGKNTPQNSPFNNLLEGDPKKPKKLDLQKVDILSGTPKLAEPQVENILPGSPLFSLELSKAYPRSLQRYNSELNPDQWQLGSDWEQSMADNQSRTTKYGRGAVNMGRTFYNTALETVASPFAVGPGAWNSPFWRDLDKAKQDYKEDFPIYKKEGYDDMGFFERTTRAAFWADEFMEGVGFFTGAMAGAVLSSGVYGGGLKTLANPRLIKNIARGGRLSLFRGLAKGGVKGADDVYKGVSKSIFLKEGLKNRAKQLASSLGKSNLLMTSLFAARSESAVEARDVVKSTYETLQNRYVKENNLSGVSEIPGIVKSKLYNTAIGLGNQAFTNNFALLTLTNMATFKLLGLAGNVGTRSIGSSMIGRYLNTPVKGGITRLQDITGLGARGARNLRRSGRLGQGMFVESIGQEYPQYVIQDASVNYAVDKHFEGSTKALSEHYLHSAANAFSDPHGQTAIALGALISAFAMGGGRVSSRVFKKYSTQGQKIEANIEELLDLVKAGKFSERQQQTDNMNIVEKNMLEAQTLWEQGENKLAQNARDRAVAAYVAQLMQFEGGINNMTATLDEIEQDLTDEQFAEMVGQPLESLVDENGEISMQTKQEYTRALKEKAENLAGIYKDIQVAFPALATPNRAQYAIATKEQEEEYKEEVAIREYLKTQLYYTLSGSYLSEKAGNELLDAMEESTGVNKDSLQKELDKILEDLNVGLTEDGKPGQPVDPKKYREAIEKINEELNNLVAKNQNINRRDRKGRFTANSDTFLELAADYMMHRLNANHAVELYNELVGDNKSNRQKLRAEAAQEAKEAKAAEKKHEEESLEHRLKTAVTPSDLDGEKGGVRTKTGRAISRRRKELTRQQKELYKEFDNAADPEGLREELKSNRSEQKQAEIDAAYSYWNSSKRRTATAENQGTNPETSPTGKTVETETDTPAMSTSTDTLKAQAREASTKNTGKKGKPTKVLPKLTPEQKEEQRRILEQTTPKGSPADLINNIEGPPVEAPTMEPKITPEVKPKNNKDQQAPQTAPVIQERTDKKGRKIEVEPVVETDKEIITTKYEAYRTDEKGKRRKLSGSGGLQSTVGELRAILEDEESVQALEGLDDSTEIIVHKETSVPNKPGRITFTIRAKGISVPSNNITTLTTGPINKAGATQAAPKEIKLDSETKTDKKGRTLTYFETTKTKDGVVKTTYTLNRSDKASDQRNKAGVSVKTALTDKGFEIDNETVPEGDTVTKVFEVRTGLDSGGSAATVEFTNENGDKYDGEVLLKRKPTAPTQKAPIQATSTFEGTIQTTRGQYEFEDRENPSGGVIFDDNNDGTYSPKPFFNHPQPVRYEELADPTLKVGDSVEIELDEGAEFFEFNRKKFKTKELENWQFAPMYLRNPKTQERISLLQMDVLIQEGKIIQTGKNPIRKQIYDNLQARNKVTLQITDKKFNKGNILNAKTPDGKRIESKLSDVFSNSYTIDSIGVAVATENAPIPLIFTTHQDGVTGFTKLTEENSPSEMTRNHIAKVNKALDSMSELAYPGVVYTSTVTPDGDVTIIPLSTAFLNETAVEEVVDLIKDGSHSDISNIAGLQVAGEVFSPQSFAQEDIKQYLMFEPQVDTNNKDYIYRFRLPGLEDGQVIKMFGKQMSNMLKGIKFSYIIEAPTWNNTYGRVDYKAASAAAYVTDPEGKKDFQDRFKDLLRNRRYQVAKETANRPEQFNKLTQDSLGRNERRNVTDTSADTILTTNVYNNNGSLFFDVTLTIGNPTVTSKGAAKGKTTTKKIKPSVSTSSKTAPGPNPNDVVGLGNVPEDTRGNVFGAKPKPTQTSDVDSRIEEAAKPFVSVVGEIGSRTVYRVEIHDVDTINTILREKSGEVLTGAELNAMFPKGLYHGSAVNNLDLDVVETDPKKLTKVSNTEPALYLTPSWRLGEIYSQTLYTDAYQQDSRDRQDEVLNKVKENKEGNYYPTIYNISSVKPNAKVLNTQDQLAYMSPEMYEQYKKDGYDLLISRPQLQSEVEIVVINKNVLADFSKSEFQTDREITTKENGLIKDQRVVTAGYEPKARVITDVDAATADRMYKIGSVISNKTVSDQEAVDAVDRHLNPEAQSTQESKPQKITQEYLNTLTDLQVYRLYINQGYPDEGILSDENDKRGNLPFRLGEETPSQKIQREKAVEYLETRFPGFGVNIFEKAQQVGDGVAHGWFENMAFHVWANAEIGTEYHEAFHGMFRMFLTDPQRSALYKEANTKFSKEDVQNKLKELKNIYSALDKNELRNLALEELMAEGFRNYRLTEELDNGGFKKAILNFFKDLYTFIKALVTEKVTMDQVFRIADARKGTLLGSVKAKMMRNSGKFVSTNVVANRVFMHMEGFGSKAQKMVVETIATQFMDLAESREETDGLLNKSDEDSIPVWWLRHSFRDNQGNPLDAALAMELAEVIESNDPGRAAEILKENPILDPNRMLSLPDRDDSGNPLQFDNDIATKKQLSSVFYQVYKNWDTKVEDNTGNVIQQGWVEALKTRMATQALRINAVTQLIEAEELEEQDNQVLTKIYDKPQIETDPMLEGTAALRPIFNKFKNIEPNFLGYRTVLAPQEVMREVQTYLSDTLSFSEGLANMLSAAQFRPEIREIVDTIKSLPADTQAKIDYHLRLGYNKFMMVDVTEEGTKFYASNQGSLTKAKLNDWKRSSRRLPNTFVSDYLYNVTVNQETKTQVLSVTDAKASRIVQEYNKAVKGILNERKGGIDPVTDSSENISSPIKALNNLIWGMGIKLMDTKKSSEQALQAYINTGVKEFRGDDVYTMQGQELLSELINQNQNGLILLVKKIANVKASGLVLIDEDVTAKKEQIDIFDEHRRLLGEFAKVSKMFNKPKSEAFIAANGKKVFPNNKYTFLGKHVLRLSTDNKYFRDTVDMYMADPAFNPNGTDQLMSLTFRVLTDPKYGESIRANFERTMYDGYKKKFESVSKTDYKNQDEFQSLEVRLHHFINAGNSKYTRVAIPTQAGRSRNDYVQVPRLNTMEKNFGIKYDRSAEIRAVILQDLARIAQAEDFVQSNPESKYDEVYHTGERYRTMSFEFLELPEDDNGENPSAYVEEYLESVSLNTDPTGNVAFVEKFLQEAEEKVIEHIAKSEKRVAKYIAQGGITLKDLNPDYLKTLGYRNLGDVITQYVEHDLIWQSVEFAKVFANGIYNYKNTEDYYKRMSTITTPISQLAVQGTLTADVNFGMPKEFTKAVLSDVELGMEARDVLQHEADLQTIITQLRSQSDNLLVTPEKIQAIEKSYAVGRDAEDNPIVNKTDATGIISVEFRKGMMQSQKKWTDSHEEAYQNDLKPDGRFVDNEGNVPTLLPEKPFMREASLKDGRVQQFIGKNSFVALTKELASRTPVLLDIYNRMNAVGPYSKLNKIQVVNMESAEKASRSGIHTLYAENGAYVPGQLKDLASVTHQSDNLGIGQEIRDKEKEEVTVNRQFRKGLLSIIIPAEDYTVNGYLQDESKRLDLTGEELGNLLQAVNVEIAARNFNDFLNKSGLRGLANNKRQNAEKKLETLKQLRNSFYGQLQDLNSLYLTAMDIVPNDITEYSYRLPMSYPPIANKMGQLFFSGFSKATHKAKTRGVEAVQVSELGGTERDGELRFLRVEEDKAGDVAVAHAEIDIKRSVAMKMGMELEEGSFVIGYRVPNQGPSSTLILKIRSFLPESHAKAVRVPGAITTQSGSDFDIDKLFILFPELDANGGKIFPNVDTLKRTGYKIKELKRALRSKKITDAMLKNLIIDLNTAVYTNPVHLIETMEPLDAGLKVIKETLQEVETTLNKAGVELAPTLSVNDPLTPIHVEVMNKTGVIGRGLKANALAGLQTAIGSNITAASTHAPRVRRDDGTVIMLDTVVQRDYTGTQTTGRNISLGLNRAVDSEKTPAELYKLNEHPFNSTVVSYLQSFGVPERESYMLLQMPGVRNVSEKYRISGRGIDSMRGFVETEIKKYIPKANRATLEQDPIPLEFAEMQEMLTVTDENKSMQGAYLITYYKHFMAADAHRDVNTAITPDTLDRVNEPAGINAYFDFVDNVLYKTDEDKLIFGAENVLVDDSYPLQKKFYENIVKAAQLSTSFGFVEFTQSAQKLKQDIRHMLNYEALDVDQHRLIDRAVYTILMSDVQSPFHWVYQRGYVEELLMGDNNISYRLEELKEKHPRLMNNEFFRRLSPHPTNIAPENKVFPIVFENMEDYNGDIREEIETDSYRLYFETQEYVDTIEGQNEVRSFMKDVVANAFLSGGFFKSPFSYFDMIHYDVQEAVSEPITVDDTVLNITNFFNQKFIKLAGSPDALNQMSHEIIRSIGKFKAGKKRLVPSISVKGKEVAGGVLKVTAFRGLYSDNMGYPRYIVADIRGKEREARLMRLRGFDSKNSAIYDFINEKSQQYKLLELGIREETGVMMSRSLVNEGGTTELANTSQNVINKKKAKTVEQDLDPRKICIRL